MKQKFHSKEGKIKLDDDLIRRSDVLKLIEDIKCNGDIPKNYGTLLDIMRLIRRLPVAYDVERVISQLVEEYQENVDMDTGVHCNNWVVDMQNEMIDNHIKIVKDGYTIRMNL